MAGDMAYNAKTLQEEIRKQFGSAGTSRFLRSLPGLKVEQGIPDRFCNLLNELDRVESDRNDNYARGARG